MTNPLFLPDSPVRASLLAVVALALITSPQAFAQSAPLARASTPSTAATELVVELPPFVVNTDRDAGYMANTTLSGTRTNTDIRDVANPLDIFTAELMRDLAIQDIQNLVNFANGVEANAAGDYNGDGQEREVWNYNYMVIRGFKTGVLTRNFMDLNAQFEAYNSDRVEFSKGPNAILAGTGGPGGSVNYATKTPRLLRNTYEVSHTTDDLGSMRATADVDTVVIKDKLGFRLNVLTEDQDFYRHPAYEEQAAWHLTGRWRPWKHTTLTAGYEDRRSNRASPRGIFANDRVTLWTNAGSKIVTGVPSNNNVIIEGSTTPQAAASIGAATLNGDNWVIDSDGVIRNTRGTARGNVAQANATNLDTAATGVNYPLDTWIGGPNGINDSDWKIFETDLTHRVAENFYVSLSYGHTDNRVRQGNSVSRELHLDPNKFGENRHPGEMYAETRPFWIDRGIFVDHYRGSASYELDLTKHNRWLGRHSFAAAYEFNEREEWWNNGRLTLTATPAGPINPASYGGGYQNSALAFNIRDYLDPEAGIWSGRDLRDLYYSPGINKDGYKAEFLRREGYASTHTLTQQDTLLGVWQSRWWDDRIVATVGLRKDERKERRAGFVQDSTGIWVPKQLLPGSQMGATHPQHANYTEPTVYNDGISRNYGGVFHATKWLSLTYNHATNFSPRVESTDMYGKYLAPSTGESDDVGFRLSLFDNKLNATFVHFETSELASATNGNAINSPISDLIEIEEILVQHGIMKSTPLSGVFTTADRTAKGEELTILGNPTPNWTFRLAASRLENRQTNLAPDVRAYYNEKLPFYKKQDQSLTLAGSTTTLAQRITEAETAYALMDTREGVQVFPASEYAVRFTGKYSFRNPSPLKGLELGGTVHWTSAPIIGYYKTAANSFDSTRYYKGEDPAYLDLFFSYERKISRDLRWRIQLNISNVLDNADPQPVAAINDVDAADYRWMPFRYRPVDGRIFVLTNTISF